MATLSRKVRTAIEALSTGGVGTYYPSPGEFFARLEWVLRENGFEIDLDGDENPPIHTSEGRGRIGVTLPGMDEPLFDIVFTWYRMPSTNWEMICYPSC